MDISMDIHIHGNPGNFIQISQLLSAHTHTNGHFPLMKTTIRYGKLFSRDDSRRESRWTERQRKTKTRLKDGLLYQGELQQRRPISWSQGPAKVEICGENVKGRRREYNICRAKQTVRRRYPRLIMRWLYRFGCDSNAMSILRYGLPVLGCCTAAWTNTQFSVTAASGLRLCDLNDLR